MSTNKQPKRKKEVRLDGDVLTVSTLEGDDQVGFTPQFTISTIEELFNAMMQLDEEQRLKLITDLFEGIETVYAATVNAGIKPSESGLVLKNFDWKYSK